MHYMNIGQAAAAAGVSPKMARHYESIGLIPEAERTAAGYRLYSEREVDMLRFIRQSRELGFSMKQIESLLTLLRDDQRESRAVKELALNQLAELQQRRREIGQMEKTLKHLVQRCAGDAGSDCAILDNLSHPTHRHEHPPLPITAAATLKQVKPGTGKPPRAMVRTHQATPVPEAHADLMAWTRSLAVPSQPAA